MAIAFLISGLFLLVVVELVIDGVITERKLRELRRSSWRVLFRDRGRR